MESGAYEPLENSHHLRWLTVRRMGGTRVQKLAENASAMDEALRMFYRERRRDLTVAVGWHLLAIATGILQTGLFSVLGLLGYAWLTFRLRAGPVVNAPTTGPAKRLSPPAHIAVTASNCQLSPIETSEKSLKP